MKKLFTIDDFMIAFVGAIGYGLGFEIPKILGWPEWQCSVACCVVGFVLQELATRVIFSKIIQKKPAYRFLAFAVFIFCFLAVQYAVVSWMGLSILEHLLQQYAYVIILPVLGFAFTMAVRWYRIRKSANSTETGATALYLTKR